MSETFALFPDLVVTQPSDARTTGILPSQRLEDLVAAGYIRASSPIAPTQIQPSSIDLRLGSIGYEVCASFLPSNRATVEMKLRELKVKEFDLSRPVLLEKGKVYIVPLQEEAAPARELLREREPEKQHRTAGRLYESHYGLRRGV